MSKWHVEIIYSFYLSFIYRLENREIYSTSSSSIARSKSPNIFNRKALDSNTAVNKTNAGGSGQKQQQPQQQQRARTASMPGENRKVKFDLEIEFAKSNHKLKNPLRRCSEEKFFLLHHVPK